MPQESGKERRKYSRFETDAKVQFQVTFDIRTKVNFQLKGREALSATSPKYSAVSKNVSAEGLAFESPKDLLAGDKLSLEVFIPSSPRPVPMEGEVRWCVPREGGGLFDTGVKIFLVENTLVEQTIAVDPEHKVVWSIVLESVFGSFKDLMKSRR